MAADLLFGIPAESAPPAADIDTEPVWTRYNAKTPLKCDDCMVRLASNGGKGQAAAQARWKRRVGEDVRLLCDPHAHWHRHDDQLPVSEPLRVDIHRHLRKHPDLTAHEIGRVLGRSPGAVAKALRVMEDDGEAERHVGTRTPSDHRPAIRWRAT
jgi:hypothetical protein